MNDQRRHPSEFDLIENIFAPLAKSYAGAANLKDDCAILSVSSGYEPLYTMDTLVEGVHFFGDDPPNLIAKKLLRVSLSDIASSGGVPKAYLLALSLPTTVSYEWLKVFAAGLTGDQKFYNVVLLGGDTTSTRGPLTLTLTAIGEVLEGKTVRRSGALIGDDIYVTGTIGDAAIALRLRDEIGAESLREQYPKLYERYLLPQPRVELGYLLVGLATACVDISDGFHADLKHICDASSVGAKVLKANIPVSSLAKKVLTRQNKYWDSVFGGGDDYELLFTSSPENKEKIKKIAKESGVFVSKVGCTVAGSKVSIFEPNGDLARITNSGWTHF